jgi:Na+/H+ antiporter NhaC
MKILSGKTAIVLIGLALLAAPLVFALAEDANDFHEEGEEGLELGVVSGLITFICVISTVVVGRLMRKGKAKVTTHHTLAYITVAVALFHGVYNLLAR